MTALDPHRQPRLEPFQATYREPGRRLHPALREPLRLAVIVGAGMLIAGSISSWEEIFIPGRGWFDKSAFEGANDGGITLELALGMLAVAISERAWGARLAVLVVAPFALGLVAVLDLLVAYGAATDYLNGEALRSSSGQGYILPGFWLTAVGAVTATVAGAIRVWRARHETRWTIRVARSLVGATVGGVTGATAGFIAGVTFGERMTVGAVGGAAGGAVVVFALGFGFAGAWLGAVTGSYLATMTQRS
jgi:hypothetical protein